MMKNLQIKDKMLTLPKNSASMLTNEPLTAG